MQITDIVINILGQNLPNLIHNEIIYYLYTLYFMIQNLGLLKLNQNQDMAAEEGILRHTLGCNWDD